MANSADGSILRISLATCQSANHLKRPFEPSFLKHFHSISFQPRTFYPFAHFLARRPALTATSLPKFEQRHRQTRLWIFPPLTSDIRAPSGQTVPVTSRSQYDKVCEHYS